MCLWMLSMDGGSCRRGQLAGSGWRPHCYVLSKCSRVFAGLVSLLPCLCSCSQKAETRQSVQHPVAATDQLAAARGLDGCRLGFCCAPSKECGHLP